MIRLHTRSTLFPYTTLFRSGNLPCDLDLAALENDLNKGLYFDSSIPQGFGVGSSGALVAAIYDQYCKNKIEEKDIRSEEHTSELQSHVNLVCRLLLEKKKKI